MKTNLDYINLYNSYDQELAKLDSIKTDKNVGEHASVPFSIIFIKWLRLELKHDIIN